MISHCDLYLNADLAGEFAKDIGQVGGEDLNEEHVEGGLVPGQDLHNLLQLVRPGQVGQDGIWPTVQNPRHIDLVDGKAVAKAREQRRNRRAVEVEKEQHGGEEQHHLPHRDEGVDKVAGALEAVLDLAELFDGGQWAAPVDIVLPPAGRDEEDGEGDGPRGVVLLADLDDGPDEEAGGLAADGDEVHHGLEEAAGLFVVPRCQT